MARFGRFVADTDVTKEDKLLGTDSGGASKNYRLEDVSKFLKNTNAAGIAAQFTYQFKTDSSRPNGSMTATFSSGSTFANLTAIEVSKFTYGEDTNSSENILGSIASKDILLVDVEDQNNFGIYTASTPTKDSTYTNFYDISLSAVQNNNGSLTNDKFYAIIVFGGGADKSYTHPQNTGATTWNVAHNLGKRPSVTVVDVNEVQGYGIVTHTDDNNLTVTFPGNTTGKAYCN